MIDIMLDTEPHLSVHQSNVFLPPCGSIDFVRVLHENIFIAQHFCAILTIHDLFLSMFGNENNDTFFMVQKQLLPHTLSGLSLRLCHCVAFTKPVWECIHV